MRHSYRTLLVIGAVLSAACGNVTTAVAPVIPAAGLLVLRNTNRNSVANDHVAFTANAAYDSMRAVAAAVMSDSSRYEISRTKDVESGIEYYIRDKASPFRTKAKVKISDDDEFVMRITDTDSVTSVLLRPSHAPKFSSSSRRDASLMVAQMDFFEQLKKAMGNSGITFFFDKQ